MFVASWVIVASNVMPNMGVQINKMGDNRMPIKRILGIRGMGVTTVVKAYISRRMETDIGLIQAAINPESLMVETLEVRGPVHLL